MDDVRRLCARIAKASDLDDDGFSVQDTSTGAQMERMRSALVVDSYPAVIMVREWLREQGAAWVQVLDEDQETAVGGDVWVVLTDMLLPPWD